ncbi:PLCG2 [Lepeophtheirus salmonis]|uniref:PLCG2 n=1 Tax=Lepeophtheirus salmonis TaxID=72036 RepID=A0A7R8H4L1_LEPSM|nr:PLCG2 [Lepeophtheirus salmonis]CAF2862410.1 PLCG2 [Lepeophtheirus salmonis]
MAHIIPRKKDECVKLKFLKDKYSNFRNKKEDLFYVQFESSDFFQVVTAAYLGRGGKSDNNIPVIPLQLIARLMEMTTTNPRMLSRDKTFPRMALIHFFLRSSFLGNEWKETLGLGMQELGPS